MSDYILQLRTAFRPPDMTPEGLISRYSQYYLGIKAFFDTHRHLLKQTPVRVFLLDNTITSLDELPTKLSKLIEDEIPEVHFFGDNLWGSQNKGAGEIQGVQYMLSEIQKHRWFIHFNPRQQIKSSYFISSFLEAPRELFTINVNPPPHFNTGLYATRTASIFRFVSQFTDARLRTMVLRKESLEHLMYAHYKSTGVPFSVLDKMDLYWFAPEGRYDW